MMLSKTKQVNFKPNCTQSKIKQNLQFFRTTKINNVRTIIFIKDMKIKYKNIC